MSKLELKSFPEYRCLTEDGNKNVVYDINTGSLTIVDDLVHDLLYKYNPEKDSFSDSDYLKSKYSDEQIKEAKETIRTQVKNNIYAEFTDFGEENALTPMKALNLTLNISHFCQLECKYCFADGGDYGRDETQLFMSWQVAKAAIDFHYDRTGSWYIPNIALFGGEPLANWVVVKKVILYAEEKFASRKGVNFSMTTNGILLNEDRIKFLNDHRVKVMISIDGSHEKHNMQRSCRNSQEDSWLQTVTAMKKWNKVSNIKYVARATITGVNSDIYEIINSILQVGAPIVSAGVICVGKEHEMALSQEVIDSIISQIKYMLESGDKISNSFEPIKNLKNAINSEPRQFACGCGVSAIAVEPDGDIYACCKVVGEKPFYLGNVTDRTFNIKRSESIRSKLKIENMLLCNNCWLKYFCNGGCPAENYNANGDLIIPYSVMCQIMKEIAPIVIKMMVLNS